MRNHSSPRFLWLMLVVLAATLGICAWATSAQQTQTPAQPPAPAQTPPQSPVSPVPLPQTPPAGKDDEPQAVTERAPVAKQEQARVLEPTQFANFRFPIITNKGEIAFLGISLNPEDKTRAKQTIFIRQPDGAWRTVREGVQAEGEKGGLYAFGFPWLADNGNLIFMGEPPLDPKALPQALDPNDPAAHNAHPAIYTRALYWQSAMGLKNLLKLGVEVPKMPSTLTGISNATINSQGTVAFIATYVDPDGRGMFYLENGEMRIIARSGQKIAPGSEYAFSEHYYPSQINERNEVAFLSRLGADSGIFVSRPSGIELITMMNKPAVLKDTNFIGFGNRAPGLNNKGEVVFVGFTNNPEAQRALFVKGAGPLKMVARSGAAIPGTTYAFTDFYNPAINDRGDIAFLGRFGGRAQGIFLLTAKGVIEQIAVNDQLIPGGDRKKEEFFNNFTQPAINNRGEVVFYAQIKMGDTAIFHRDEKGVLKMIARRGDPMPK